MPLVLSAVCVAGVLAAATAPSGAPAPVPVAQQGGHWVVNGGASAALHVHGGTAQVDARVDLPPDALRDGLSAVAGDAEGFVVGRDRVWTFDRSTLTVVAEQASAVSEVPVPVEVVGGPYLVYREAGTVVRLGAPAVVLDAGGPLGSPVRTPDGTVAAHRADTGAVCGLHRDALELDCAISAPPGSRGGLSAVGATVVFVDTGSDAAHRVLFGSGLDGGTPLGTDLPADALLGDRAAGDRLPVVLPGENVLRLVDVSGLEALRPGTEPIDVPLGEGAFSAPVVGEASIALLDLASGRLITFAPDGTRTGEVELPPGSTADDLVRGEDGRLYLDEAGGSRVHVVQPGGSVDTVEVGDARGPAVAAAPPPEQLAPVRPPLPGQAVVPPDVLAQPVGAPVGGAVVALPGLDGPPLPGAGQGPGGGAPLPEPELPDVLPPDADPGAVPPDADPGAPVVPDEPLPPPEAPDAVGEFGPPPVGLSVRRVDEDLSVVVEWAPPATGPAPTAYRISSQGSGNSVRDTVAGLQFVDRENYCSLETSYGIWAVGADGELGEPAYVELSQGQCIPDSEIVGAEGNPDGTLTVRTRCFTDGRPVQSARLALLVDGDEVAAQACEMVNGATQELHTFDETGFVRGRTYSVSTETNNGVGFRSSDPVTVTIP